MQEVLFPQVRGCTFRLHCSPSHGLMLTKLSPRSPDRTEVLYPFVSRLEDACRQKDTLWLLCSDPTETCLLLQHRSPSWNKRSLPYISSGRARFCSPHHPALLYEALQDGQPFLFMQDFSLSEAPSKPLCPTVSRLPFAAACENGRTVIFHFQQPRQLVALWQETDQTFRTQPILETDPPDRLSCLLWQQWAYVLLENTHTSLLGILSSRTPDPPRLFPLENATTPRLQLRSGQPFLCMHHSHGWQCHSLLNFPGPALSCPPPDDPQRPILLPSNQL
ncbi:MAG: hypothetical protein ACOX7F_08280 [Eubacteriales bacterium]|jgi:hypothetical protein